MNIYEEMIEAKQQNIKELEAKVDELKGSINEKLDDIAQFDKWDYLDVDDVESELREWYGDVDVCGVQIDAIDILKRMDRCAFDELVSYWVDSKNNEDFVEYVDMQNELDSLEDELDGYQIEILNLIDHIEILEQDIANSLK